MKAFRGYLESILGMRGALPPAAKGVLRGAVKHLKEKQIMLT